MSAPSPTSTTPAAESTDLREYVRPIWAHKILILALVIVATIGTYEYYNRKPKLYQSATTVFVGQTTGSSDASSSTGQDRVLNNQARLVQTADVAAQVAKKIGFRGNPAALLGGVSVVAATD